MLFVTLRTHAEAVQCSKAMPNCKSSKVRARALNWPEFVGSKNTEDL